MPGHTAAEIAVSRGGRSGDGVLLAVPEGARVASVQLFACPECGLPTRDVRRGKELEVFALEIQEDTVQEQQEEEGQKEEG
jgi:hypothetical protein